MNPNEITYDYDGVPTVREFSRDDSPIRSIIGPFGSGKSVGCGPIEIMRRAAAQMPNPRDGIKRSRWAVIRNTYKELEDTTIKTFFDWLPPNYFGEYLKGDHDYHITAFPDMDVEIQFRAMDRPEHVRKVLSYEITGAFLNEARELPWALIGPLYGRTGRYPKKIRDKDGKLIHWCTWRGLWMDSNAPPLNHWLYRIHTKSKLTEHEQKLLKYWHTWNQPGGRDPNAENLDHLPDDYYEMQAAIMTEDQIKVYIDNQYGYLQQGKACYPTWRDQLHLRKGLFPQDKYKILRGWDFGLTPACVLAYVAPNGQLRGFMEFTTDRAGIKEFAVKVVGWCSQNLKGFKFEDWGDPSGDAGRDTSDGSCFTVLEALGVMIQGASNDLTIRLESVRWGLDNLIDGEAAMVIDAENCMMLVEGFQGGYHYRRILTSASERYSEAEPDKNTYSHPHDAWQYITQVVFADMINYGQNDLAQLKVASRQMIEDDGLNDFPDEEDEWWEGPSEQIV